MDRSLQTLRDHHGANVWVRTLSDEDKALRASEWQSLEGTAPDQTNELMQELEKVWASVFPNSELERILF